MAALADIDGKALPLQVPNLDGMTKDELKALIARMAEDWRMLNAIHNNRANDHGWCSEYEERQQSYNCKFQVFSLTPRPGRSTVSADGHTGMQGQGL